MQVADGEARPPRPAPAQRRQHAEQRRTRSAAAVRRCPVPRVRYQSAFAFEHRGCDVTRPPDGRRASRPTTPTAPSTPTRRAGSPRCLEPGRRVVAEARSRPWPRRSRRRSWLAATLTRPPAATARARRSAGRGGDAPRHGRCASAERSCSTSRGRPRAIATTGPGPSRGAVVIRRRCGSTSRRVRRSGDGDVAAERDERARHPSAAAIGARPYDRRPGLGGRAEVELDSARDPQRAAARCRAATSWRQGSRGAPGRERPRVALAHERERAVVAGGAQLPIRASDRRVPGSCHTRVERDVRPARRAAARRRLVRPAARWRARARSRGESGCTPRSRRWPAAIVEHRARPRQRGVIGDGDDRRRAEGGEGGRAHGLTSRRRRRPAVRTTASEPLRVRQLGATGATPSGAAPETSGAAGADGQRAAPGLHCASAGGGRSSSSHAWRSAASAANTALSPTATATAPPVDATKPHVRGVPRPIARRTCAIAPRCLIAAHGRSPR